MNLTITAPKLFGEKRKGDGVYIYLPDNSRKLATYLGSGRFTSAYLLNNNDVFLYTFYDDHSKDILSQCWAHFKNPHIPYIESLGPFRYSDRGPVFEAQVYVTRFYNLRPKLENMPRETRELARALKKAHMKASATIEGHLVNERKCSIFNRMVADNKHLPHKMQLALEHLTYSALNWGDHYLFDDFRLQNLGLDDKGQLILVDPLFDAEKIYHDIKRRLKQWRLKIIR